MVGKINIEGSFALFGAFLYHIIIGCFYLFGALSIYVASYYYQYDITVNTRFLMLFLPFRGILVLFTLPLGAYLNSIWNPRKY